ncbi:hypothetical protein AVEN_640-1, partial [Araneus ventricosus]
MAIVLHYVDVVAGCTRWFQILPGSGLPRGAYAEWM